MAGRSCSTCGVSTGSRCWRSSAILPNYTLLDDGVVLDVALTWIDPETQEFRSEPTSYRRSSANALREFAPGATFYARGWRSPLMPLISAPTIPRSRPWRSAPTADTRPTSTAVGADGVAAACPRCGSPGISGSEHHLDVVELSRVSAEMRRDEAGISDRNDERKRERFTIAVAADIDPPTSSGSGTSTTTTSARSTCAGWTSAG